MPTDDDLDGGEVVMIIEALDALLPFAEDTRYWSQLSPDERERWMPYRVLRGRLKEAVHMSFYDRARNWLDSELRGERIALTERLHTRLAELLRTPGATRRTRARGLRQGDPGAARDPAVEAEASQLAA